MAALEFEKKIEELTEKINTLKIFSEENDVDLSKEIEKIQLKIEEIKQEGYSNLSAWDRLTLARLVERPTALDYIENIFDNFIEFHGDRNFGDDKCIIGGIAEINGKAVTVIAQQKGRNTKENIERNFGMPNPEGYRKALRLMKQAEKFKRPVICFIDTPGAFCGIGAEERGQGEAIGKNLMEMSSLKAPIISIIIGEGGSGGALALGVADKVCMLENSIYSLLSPEGFASILWKDSSRAKEAAEVMKITAKDLKNYGIIDEIIKEPTGGAHKEIKQTSEWIKNNILEFLKDVKEKDIETIIEERYLKFRKLGSFCE